MQHSKWTIRTIENGETGSVKTGLSHQEAVRAIQRAMSGQDPILDTGTHKAVRLRSRGEHAARRARVAA